MITFERYKKFILLVLCGLILIYFVTDNTYINAIGMQEIEFIIPQTDRKLVAAIYYPHDDKSENKMVEKGLWQLQASVKNAPLSAKKDKYPLVIISHGHLGNKFSISWIAESLVKEGYIAVIIEHTHNTSYDHNSLFIYTSMWQRPLDMSALLTYLLQHPTWGKSIDQEKIVAGGFSLGGYTALSLGGIQGDPELFRNSVEYFASWDLWSESEKSVALGVDWNKAACSYYDSRIKAVFAISPGLAKGFKPEGLLCSKVPVLIIVGKEDRITPAKEIEFSYASHIPHSKFYIIKEAAHFTFLNSCSNLGKIIEPSLCSDAPCVDRLKVHKEAEGEILKFLHTVFED